MDTMDRGESLSPLTKRKRGRPKKSEIVAKKKPGVPGRPKGDAAIMADYKARMLASPQSRLVLEKVFETALNDDHKHQAACMKMIMDRVLPIGAFESDFKQTGGKNAISINITGLGGDVTIGASDTSKSDYSDLSDTIEGDYGYAEE